MPSRIEPPEADFKLATLFSQLWNNGPGLNLSNKTSDVDARWISRIARARELQEEYTSAGDPDHPINRGTLCPKGSSLLQDIVNDRRLLKPQVRRPESDHWEDISWDQAIDEIATRTKQLRDADFIEQVKNGKTVNRWESLAFAGGCTDTNEFNYLVVKSMRSMGVTGRDAILRKRLQKRAGTALLLTRNSCYEFFGSAANDNRGVTPRITQAEGLPRKSGRRCARADRKRRE